MAIRILVAAAFVLIAGLVYTSWQSIEEMLAVAPWEILALAIAALALANVGMALVFSTLVQRTSRPLIKGRRLAGSFLISQVAKYIPGRVWGVAMQAVMLGAPASTSRILAVNLELALANLALVTGSGMAFLAWQHWGPVLALLVLLATWVLVGWMLRLGGVDRMAALVSRLLPRAGNRLLAGFTSHGVSAREGGLWRMYCGLLIFLLMYSAGWWLLASSLTERDSGAAMGIVAALSLSYVVGVASMLPAGIGAREGALVLLAPVLGVPHVDMAAFAVASRVALVLIDAVAAGIGAVLLRVAPNEGGVHV